MSRLHFWSIFSHPRKGNGRIYQKFFGQFFVTYLLMFTSYFFKPLAILEICFLLNISLSLQGSLCRYYRRIMF